MKYFSFLIVLLSINSLNAQNPNKNYGSYKGSVLKRVFDINQAFGQGRGETLTVGDLPAEDANLNYIYRSTEKGPYLDNEWFEAGLLTFNDELFESPDYLFRYDLFRHLLHYGKEEADNDALVLNSIEIEGFFHEDGRFFKKIGYDELNPFVEVISDGKYTIAIYRTAKVVIISKAGPASDGRSKKKFRYSEEMLFSNDGKYFQSISPKVKSLLKIYPELNEKFEVFEREVIKSGSNEEELISFVVWLNEN